MAVDNIKIPDFDLVSEREFAALLGKSLRTLKRWHLERRGPKRTVLGRTPYYSRKEILRWFSERDDT